MPESEPQGEFKPEIQLPTTIIPERENFNSDASLPEMSPQEKEHFEKILEKAREQGDIVRRFWNMLVTEIPKTEYSPPKGRKTTILNLGCGVCQEGRMLSSFFGGEEFGSEGGRNVDLIGVDVDPKEIERAKKDHQIPGYEFIVGDATNLDQYSSIPTQVDVVVIRHQQISHNKNLWQEIFQQALRHVTPEGIILITSFSDIENEMLVETLQTLNCEMIINERNPYAKPTTTEGLSIDRNITIVRSRTEFNR